MRRGLSGLFLTAVLLIGPVAPASADIAEAYAAYNRGEFKKAFAEFSALAEKGNSIAQANLGFMYHRGQGVEQNYAEAIKWYRRAAERGRSWAQYNLAVIYHFGEANTPADIAEAVKWYRLAAAQGDPDARFNLGGLYELGQGVDRDLVLAYMWYALSVAVSLPGADQDAAVESRDAVAKQLSPADLEQAEKLVTEWKPASAP